MALSKIKGTVIADNAINADRIADGTVVASDLLDNTITGAKLATDIAITTSGNITTTGAFTSTGIDDNATSTAITINSSNYVGTSTRVGIGTTNPSQLLEIYGTSPNIQWTYSGDDNNHRIFSFSDDFYIRADANNTGAGNLVFQNGGSSERMRIDSSGNVGIGTSSPNNILEVSKSNAGSATSIIIRNQNGVSTLGNKSELHLANTNSLSHGAKITADFVGTPLADHETDLVFYTTNPSSTLGERMRIDGSGNVGIGTSSPSLASGNGVVISGGSSVARLELRNTTSGTTSSDGAFLSYSANDLFLGNRESGNSIFYTNNAERMRIDSPGKVGIGVTNPVANLEVRNETDNGHTHNIKITNSGWGDSIGYLKSLSWGDPNTLASIGSEFDGSKVNMHFHSFYNGGYKTETTKLMTILGNGNVGIGTTSPGTRLSFGNYIPSNGQTIHTYQSGNTVSGLGIVSSVHRMFTNSGSSISFGHVSTSDGSTYSEAMRIASNGNVGIGTSSPETKFHVSGGTTNTVSLIESTDAYAWLSIKDNSSANSYINSIGASGDNLQIISKDITFRTSSTPNVSTAAYGTERMRINSSGKVGINLSSPHGVLDVGANAGGSGLTTISASTGINLANEYHEIMMVNNGGSYGAGLRRTLTQNTPSYLNPRLDFVVQNNNTSEVADRQVRMTILGNGRVGIGTSSPANKLHVAGLSTLGGFQSTYSQLSFIKSSNANNYTLQVHATSASPGVQYVTEVNFSNASPDNSSAKFFQMRDSTTARVNINSDGDFQNHDNTYGAISDERIKQNIVDAGSQWNDIKNIRVRKYKKKDDVLQYGEANAPLELGVISQELESVSPGLIKEDKPDSSHVSMHSDFAGDNPQNVKYVKYSILYIKAIKALQEAMERIETLEAKVQTLENNQP